MQFPYFNVQINSFSLQTIRSIGSKNNRSCQPSTVEKCVNSAEMSTLLTSESEEQGDKENTRQIKQTVPIPGKKESCIKINSQ